MLSGKDFVGRAYEESGPAPAMEATPSEYHSKSGGLVGSHAEASFDFNLGTSYETTDTVFPVKVNLDSSDQIFYHVSKPHKRGVKVFS